MARCTYCKIEIDLPFICNYCKKPFCVNHRLPEAHDCPNLIFTRPPSGTSRETWSYRGRTRQPTFTHKIIPNILGQKFYGSELKQLVIAWFVLSFCFSIRYLFSSRVMFPMMFLISLATLGLGFIGHELSHRYAARRFGCWAEFRLWPLGLVMALLFALVSGGSIIFAAPGAVYIVPRSTEFGYTIGKRENGLISLSGPLANILVAVFFFALGNLGGILSLVGSTGFYVNLWLAAFNLIPFGMMDGRKVLSWSPLIWGLVAIPTWILVFLPSIMPTLIF